MMPRPLYLFLLLLCALAAESQSQKTRTTNSASSAAEAPRVEVSLRDGWRLKLGPESATELQVEPDATWATVSVPHTWNRVGYYKDTPASHINTAQNVVTTQGVGWYKLAFTPPTNVTGMESFLQFDAASRIATVWLNGTLLGTHKGGFSRFRLDSTAALKPGQMNLLTVKVDNTKPALGSSTADVLPLTGDFFVYGGLYRPVSLVFSRKVHFDLMDYGSAGVYAKTTSLASRGAHVEVCARLRNDGEQSNTVMLRTLLINSTGKVAAQQEQSFAVEPGRVAERVVNIDVPHPHLWQGVEDPYLYRLVAEISDKSAQLVDRVSIPFGIRQVRFDPNDGLFLNGKHVAVHGVGYHQDREGKGWASEPADAAADEATMREMGVTGVRLTHYQHGQPIHDLADRDGLVVWDEIPLVSQWTLGESLQPTEALRENARQQLRELVAQDFNHPSVITWSIGNEIDFGNTIPAFVGNTRGAIPDPLPLLKELNQLAHELDPGRPTTLATCCEARYAPGTVPITGAVTDLSGANRYFGWYYDKPSDFAAHLDMLHKARPTQPQAVTEYGAGGAISLHSDNALGGPESRNRPQAEEYQSYIHEQNWATMRDKPYLWGTFLWNSFDFGSTTRNEGNAQDINTKGIVTFDHKSRKDSYFFYKANWTANPTVHINSSLYTERAYRTTDVRVYSNASKTSLQVDGKLIGVLADCPDHICVWKGVTLTSGTNNIVASGSFPKGDVEDKAQWHLSDAAAKTVNIDCGALVPGAGNEKHFGSDTFFEGGTAKEISNPQAFGKAPVPVRIADTGTPEIASTYRSGSFTYRIPVTDGPHNVILTFVEPSLHPGDRIFDVFANGQKVVTDLDVAAAAGGSLTAYQKNFDVKAKAGMVILEFKPTKGDALVSAIEVQ
jgi:beta-galactosidase